MNNYLIIGTNGSNGSDSPFRSDHDLSATRPKDPTRSTTTATAITIRRLSGR